MEIKERLPQIEARLTALSSEKSDALQKIQKQVSETKRNFQRQKERIEREILMTFPIPRTPNEIINEQLLKKAEQEAKKKRPIEFRELKKRNKQHLLDVSQLVKRYMNE